MLPFFTPAVVLVFVLFWFFLMQHSRTVNLVPQKMAGGIVGYRIVFAVSSQSVFRSCVCAASYCDWIHSVVYVLFILLK